MTDLPQYCDLRHRAARGVSFSGTQVEPVGVDTAQDPVECRQGRDSCLDTEAGQYVGAGIGGPFGDRRDRGGPGDRCCCGGQYTGQMVSSTSRLTWIRHQVEGIEDLLRGCGHVGQLAVECAGVAGDGDGKGKMRMRA